MQRINDGENAEVVLQELSYKLSQQMMHGPTKALQAAIQQQHTQSLNLLSDAFNLGASMPRKQE
jgi:glutamyl-tRNA reductase